MFTLVRSINRNFTIGLEVPVNIDHICKSRKSYSAIVIE